MTGHLTYCTNVHAGEDWADIAAMLERDAAAVRDAMGYGVDGTPFDLGLRLAAGAAEALTIAENAQRFTETLRAQNFTVRTLNGFPYGLFHGAPVKEQVYAPDWSTLERLTYTNRLADVLAQVLPEGVAGSISTLPVTFKPWAQPDRIAEAARNLVACATHLQRLSDTRGVDIALALEAEPRCYLETVAETIAFFEGHVFTADAIATFAQGAGLARGAAESALRRRLAVCYDVCHGAVEFETPSTAMAQLSAAGLRIAKIQLSSALKIAAVNTQARDRLAALSEPTYLHQVVARSGADLTRYTDIPDALAQGSASDGQEWRIHFHVPVFLADLDSFSTTQDALIDAIAAQRAHGYADHLEVETYTWGVLPPEHQAADLPAAIARELRWAERELAGVAETVAAQ